MHQQRRAGCAAYLTITSSGYGAPAPANNGDARIKVVGVGGGGGNALNRMLQTGLQARRRARAAAARPAACGAATAADASAPGPRAQGVEYWAINTDAQALGHHPCPNRMIIGSEVTRGLGCGGDPAMGRAAALESEDGIRQVVSGADLLFVTAGMGGGTGTGAAPVVAQISKDAGVLTVGVVTYPFSFEGRRRCSQAIKGIEALRDSVDSVIVIPNDKLLEVSGEATALTDAFALADDVLRQGVQGISDIITVPGLINVDFADIRTILTNSGTAMLGVGCASGPSRAEQAALAAVSAPLIQQSVERATGIVFNITGGRDMTLSEVNRVSQVVTGLADPAANIIFGAVVDDSFAGELAVTIVATGFSQSVEEELFGAADAGAKRRGGARVRAGAAAAAAPAAAPAPAPAGDYDDEPPAAAAWGRQPRAQEAPRKSNFFGRNLF
ncbi:FTSZ1 [Scenedesmus sp. PABB004]|nr:FTSZ1 [Scenedesmus sp. PABB004]